MLIYNLYFVGIRFTPPKTDTPLLINPKAILPFPISFELLEPIARRDAEVLQPLCNVKYRQFPLV